MRCLANRVPPVTARCQEANQRRHNTLRRSSVDECPRRQHGCGAALTKLVTNEARVRDLRCGALRRAACAIASNKSTLTLAKPRWFERERAGVNFSQASRFADGLRRALR